MLFICVLFLPVCFAQDVDYFVFPDTTLTDSVNDAPTTVQSLAECKKLCDASTDCFGVDFFQESGALKCMVGSLDWRTEPHLTKVSNTYYGKGGLQADIAFTNPVVPVSFSGVPVGTYRISVVGRKYSGYQSCSVCGWKTMFAWRVGTSSSWQYVGSLHPSETSAIAMQEASTIYITVTAANTLQVTLYWNSVTDNAGSANGGLSFNIDAIVSGTVPTTTWGPGKSSTWELVCRAQGSGNWFTTNDIQSSTGSYVADPFASSNFCRTFDTSQNVEVMFMTGNGVYCAMIQYKTFRSLVDAKQGDFSVNSDFKEQVGIGTNAGAITATTIRGNILSRVDVPEDPVITMDSGYSVGGTDLKVLWADAGNNIPSVTFKNANGGVNVYVRRTTAVPPVTPPLTATPTPSPVIAVTTTAPPSSTSASTPSPSPSSSPPATTPPPTIVTPPSTTLQPPSPTLPPVTQPQSTPSPPASTSTAVPTLPPVPVVASNAPVFASTAFACPSGSVGVSQCITCTIQKHCSGHAVSVTDDGTRSTCSCRCEDGYAGPTCSQCTPSHYFSSVTSTCEKCSSATNCNSHGTASITDGGCGCTCEAGYVGASCQQCDNGYLGYPTCVKCSVVIHCSSHAVSVRMSRFGNTCVCECKPGYTGDSCSTCSDDAINDNGECRVCSSERDCNGHGRVSSASGGKTCQCRCDAKYAGSRCEYCNPNLETAASAPYPLCTSVCDASTCSYHGVGSVNNNNQCVCTCESGYDASTMCNQCVDGYYLTESGVCSLCSIAQHCGNHGVRVYSSSDHSQCLCDCQAGYVGSNCSYCALGYVTTTSGVSPRVVNGTNVNTTTTSSTPSAASFSCIACMDEYCTVIGRGSAIVVNDVCVCSCYAGYNGSRCESCAAGYVASSAGGQCIPCTVETHCSGRAVSVLWNDDGETPPRCECACMSRYDGTRCSNCTYPRINYPACTCPDQYMSCGSACVALSRVCDRVQDCDDGADERYCSMSLISDQHVIPSSIPFIPVTGLSDGDNDTSALYANCERVSVFRGHDLLWVSDRGCATSQSAFMNFSDVCDDNCHVRNTDNVTTNNGINRSSSDAASFSESSVNDADSTSEVVVVGKLYMKVSSPSQVPPCFDTYHCSGNGALYLKCKDCTECVCSCDDAFLGETCNTRRTLSAIDILVFEMDEIVNRQNLSTAVARGLLNVSSTVSVSVDSMERRSPGVGCSGLYNFGVLMSLSSVNVSAYASLSMEVRTNLSLSLWNDITRSMVGYFRYMPLTIMFSNASNVDRMNSTTAYIHYVVILAANVTYKSLTNVSRLVGQMSSGTLGDWVSNRVFLSTNVTMDAYRMFPVEGSESGCGVETYAYYLRIASNDALKKRSILEQLVSKNGTLVRNVTREIMKEGPTSVNISAVTTVTPIIRKSCDASASECAGTINDSFVRSVTVRYTGLATPRLQAKQSKGTHTHRFSARFLLQSDANSNVSFDFDSFSSNFSKPVNQTCLKDGSDPTLCSTEALCKYVFPPNIEVSAYNVTLLDRNATKVCDDTVIEVQTTSAPMSPSFDRDMEWTFHKDENYLIVIPGFSTILVLMVVLCSGLLIWLYKTRDIQKKWEEIFHTPIPESAMVNMKLQSLKIKTRSSRKRSPQRSSDNGSNKDAEFGGLPESGIGGSDGIQISFEVQESTPPNVPPEGNSHDTPQLEKSQRRSIQEVQDAYAEAERSKVRKANRFLSRILFGEVPSYPVYRVTDPADVTAIQAILRRWTQKFWIDFSIVVAVIFLIVLTTVVVLYLLSGWNTSNYVLIVEGYRDRLCDQSPDAPVPHHISLFPMDQQCHANDALGTSIGFVTASALCHRDTWTVDVQVGRYDGECSTVPASTIAVDKGCMSEGSMFPFRSSLGGTSYYRLRCLSASAGNELIKNVTKYSYTGDPQKSVVPQNPPYPFSSGGGQKYYMQQGLMKPLNTSVQARLSAYSSWAAITSPINVRLMLFGNESSTTDVQGDIPYGMEFNNYFETTGDAQRGDSASLGAMRVHGIRGSPLDVTSMNNEFTVRTWIRASTETRGFVFVLSDAWYSEETKSSPLIERLRQTLEGSLTPWFTSYTVHLSVYADGESGTIHLVLADHGTVRKHVWPVQSVSGVNIYDDRWHQVAFVFGVSQSRPFVQLVVDGRTSYGSPGWKKCLDAPIQALTDGSRMNVFAPSTETTFRGGVMTLGHLNAALQGFEVVPETMSQADILADVSPEMREVAYSGTRSGFAGFGTFALLVWLGLCGYSVYGMIFGRKSSKQLNETDPKLGHVALLLTTSLQSQMVLISSWTFPTTYGSATRVWLQLFSMNFLSYPSVNLLVTPALQFGTGCLFVSMLVALEHWDFKKFRGFSVWLYREAIGMRRLGGGSKKDPTACTTYKTITCTNCTRMVVSLDGKGDGENNIANTETDAAGSAAINAATCTACGGVTDTNSFLEHVGVCADEISVVCPEHQCGLFPSEVPTGCVTISCSPYHTSFAGSIKTKGVESGDVWSSTIPVWRCSFPGCPYCICHSCSMGRTSPMTMVKRLLMASMPFVVIGVLLFLYIPVVETTVKVLSCHPVYECAFESCFEKINAKFATTASGALVMIIFYGAVMPVTLSFAAFRRRYHVLSDIQRMNPWAKLRAAVLGGAWFVGLGKGKAAMSLSSQRFQRFIELSEKLGLSAMTTIYEVFEPQHLFIGPAVLLLQKAVSVMCMVLIESDSMAQMATTGVVEILGFTYLTVFRPFAYWSVQVAAMLGSIHQLGLIFLSAYYRVTVVDGDRSSSLGVDGLTIAFSYGYYGLLCVFLYRIRAFHVLYVFILEHIRRPRHYAFTPEGSTVRLLVGERSTKPLLGYSMNHGERIVRKSDGLGGFAVGVDSSTWDLYWIPDAETGYCVELACSVDDGDSFECENWSQTLLGSYESCTIEEEAVYLTAIIKFSQLTTTMKQWASKSIGNVSLGK